MQLGQLKGNIVEKVLFDKSGRLVRATFCVYERDGRIKAQLVKFVFVNQIDGDSLCSLSASYNQELTEVFLSGIKNIESPYIEEVLNFSGSKPRAPTF